MPHVTVHFDSKLIDQDLVTKLKRRLQGITAKALSSAKGNSHHPTEFYRIGGGSYLRKKGYLEYIATPQSKIFVRQQAAHETDVNPSPIEIVVEAGHSKGRDADRVMELIEEKVRATKLIPPELLGEGQSCVWVKFSPENGFGFIKKYA